MDLRSPLGRVRGLGSAKSGVGHWWMQRLTAIALVPLALWFVAAFARIAGADYAVAVEWLRVPRNGILMLALIGATFYHALLGLQVVIEDYVHAGWAKAASLIAIRFAIALLAITAVISVLRISLGA
jgi:succinate dehydrogenase / fumarate reductase membrane anchor subunit